MRSLKELFFRGADQSPAGLSDEVRGALEAWRSQGRGERGQVHYYTRYVVVDVATAGLDSERDALLGIAALGLGPGGKILPDDAFVLDLPATGQETAPEALDRQLAAFLQFIGRDPLVTYQAPFVSAFLERILAARFGLEFPPDWIDLAWLLPDLFKERIDGLVPLDAWLAIFGIEVPGRCDALADCIALARLLQVALPRAVRRGADTPGKLTDISRARRWLRPSG